MLLILPGLKDIVCVRYWLFWLVFPSGGVALPYLIPSQHCATVSRRGVGIFFLSAVCTALLTSVLGPAVPVLIQIRVLYAWIWSYQNDVVGL